ncbi:hypothetical protein ABVK25_008324 [Lepraria finkii]|uniref:Uncharacterized protein n=1 Tax=Lepraria finkii TaxID=1340010 RepID=A0ABR4B0N0_9LECA
MHSQLISLLPFLSPSDPLHLFSARTLRRRPFSSNPSLQPRSSSPKPAAEACTYTFQSLQGCFQTTNQGYNSHQVGGTVNIHFDDTTDSAPVDTDLPTYGFGNAGMFGGGASS